MSFTPEQIEEMKIKADKWDALEKEINAFYIDPEGNVYEDGEEPGDLADIGEAAASAFGWL